MRFGFEVCVLRFIGFCDVMMKTLAINNNNKKKKENHNKVSFSLSNWTSCLIKH
jgi:hypothetical protein